MIIIKHDIIISSAVKGIASTEEKTYIKKCVKAALAAENAALPCEISILLTDDAGIQEINKSMREVDAPTDVLSFPMFELSPGAALEAVLTDPDSGMYPLGDMALSVERARAQAAEYGHSEKREIGYLTVHSVLHLLGYDHLDEGPDKALMRKREKEIMRALEVN